MYFHLPLGVLTLFFENKKQKKNTSTQRENAYPVFWLNKLIVINSKINWLNGPELSQLWKSFSSNNARYRSEESSLMKVRSAGSE